MLYQNSCENKILPLSLLLPLIKRLVKNVDFLPRVFSIDPSNPLSRSDDFEIYIFSLPFRRDKSGAGGEGLMGSFISHGLTAGRRPQRSTCARVWKRNRKKKGGRASEEVTAGGPLKNNGLGSVVGVTLARAKL